MLASSLEPPNHPLPPSSSSFSALDVSDPATEHQPFSSNSALEDSENNINSDPDPGCLDSDPSNQDNNASTAQPEDSSTWLNLESIFENAHLEDSLNSIEFI